MHSLKELRAENAARRLSSSRTADEADVAKSPTAVPATLATAAPRTGRTLASLAPAGAPLPLAAKNPAEPAAGDDTQQLEDREARRQRRLRRRRERGQRENNGDISKANVDDNATAVSGASRTSTSPGGDDEEGGNAFFAGEKGGNLPAGRGTDSERKSEQFGSGPSRRQPTASALFAAEQKVLDDAETIDADNDHKIFEKPQISARGAPPNEKPRKKLTPLEARRARIEQQKREEVERKPGVSGKSPRSGGPEQQRKALEAEGDVRSRGETDHADRRLGSDQRDSARGISSSTNEIGQARARNSPGDSGGSSSSEHAGEGKDTMAETSEIKEEGNGSEHDPLLSDNKTAERNSGDDDNAKGTRPDRARGEKKAEVEMTQSVGDADGVGAVALGTNSNDPLEDTAGGDGSRFQGVRNRMMKARKGLMTKRSPVPSARRRKEIKNQARGAGRKHEEQPTVTGRTSSGDTSSDTEDEGGEGREGEAGEDVSRAASDENKPGNRAHDSETSSNTSERVSEKDDVFKADSDEGGKGRKKKWRRNKGAGPPDAPLAGDKEVTLGHVVDRKMREMGYIRKPAVDELKNRRSLRDRVAAEGAPEVHFIGEISGAEGFGSGISCRFRVEGGRHWTCLAGLEEGQTHVMHTDYGETFAPWNHPIDLHYTTKSIQGWPRLMLQVWQLDTHGRNVLRGYGFRHLPSNPGFSEVSMPCWRPSGTMQEETAAFFLGVTPRLTAEDAVFNRAWDQRCRLVTLPAGTVWLQINGLFCNLQDQGVDNI